MNEEELGALKQLIEFLQAHQVGEFDLERGDLKVRLKFAAAATAQAAPHGAAIDLAQLSHLIAAGQPHPTTPAPVPAAEIHAAPVAAPPASASAAPEAELHIVKSPIVGTFYESAAPGTPAFVKAGDQVELGQVLCIVEAMKLMNEIECDVAGEIVKQLVSNGQPIEYGQPLFSVRAR